MTGFADLKKLLKYVFYVVCKNTIKKGGEIIFDINTYNPFEKTAIIRKKLSKPMRILYDKGLLKGNILDYACGNHEDCNILQDQGLNIIGYDKFNPKYGDEKLLNNTYNTITNLYMFNVIPNLHEHQRQLEIIQSISKTIYITVRSDEKAINKDKWIYSEEYRGWITSTGSFQRFYNEDIVKEYFGKVDYIVNDSSMKLFKLIREEKN